MGRIPGIRRLFSSAPARRTIDREIDDEMRFHLHARIEDLVHQGYSHTEAQAMAEREFGDLGAAHAELASIDRRRVRRVEIKEWLSSLAQDARFALRGFRSRPTFTAAVLLTLALGIGANAAIFSVVDAVLLRPLPYVHSERLVHLWEMISNNLVDDRSEASYPDYLDWRARNTSFSSMGGYHGAGFLVGSTQAMTVGGARVTANFFDVLGVRAAVGRTFAAGEDDVGAPHVVMITNAFWERQFGRDHNVLGKVMTIDGAPATVIGVLPASFQFSRQGNAEIWAPIDRPKSMREQRGNHWLNVVARLKDGVTIEAASKDMSGIMKDLAQTYPQSNTNRDTRVVGLREELIGSVKNLVLLLYGAVLVVLLVACANVANLLLMRGADREREIAVRVALGAGQGRLVRQLLTESVILALAGGIIGLGLAQVGIHSLLGVIPSTQIRTIPSLADAGLDLRIVGYAALISVLAGVGFGIMPAIRATRPKLHDTLKQSGRGTSRATSVLRNGLVISEIALTVILVAGAALFGRSLIKLFQIDTGFRPQQVVTANVVLPRAKYTDAALQVQFYRRLLESIRAVPGVEAVGTTTKMPLDYGNSTGFAIMGQPTPTPGNFPSASYRQVSLDYFRALGIPIVGGRDFGAGDDANAPNVAVVNRALANAYFPKAEAVGQFILQGNDTVHIIGVVGDVPIGKLEDRIPPTLYYTFAQAPSFATAIAVRTRGDLASTGRALRQAISGIDQEAALSVPRLMTDVIVDSPSVFLRRFPLILVGAFAGTALVLALVGIYGVVSYSVAQRTREMGIRLALGAQPRSLVAMVMRESSWVAAAGVGVGIAGALLLSRFAVSFMYGITASDPATYTAVALLLGGAALLATLGPARRATRVDPAIALREE